jgi:hypothetical protein
VTQLRPAGQLEGHSLISAVESDIERRTCFDQVGDLAQVFERAVTACDD